MIVIDKHPRQNTSNGRPLARWLTLTGRGGNTFRVAIAVVLIAVVAAEPSRAGELTMSPSMSGNLLQRTTTRVVSGRIVVTSQQTGGRQTNANRHGERSETMTMDLTAQLPSIHYQQESEQLQIFIEVIAGRSVRVRLVPGSASDLVQVEFSQQEDDQHQREPLTLSIGSGGELRTVQAESLWHLLLAEPELCRRHLTPILELLRPGWHLMQTSDEIENALCQQVSQRRYAQQSRWQELIVRLGDERYSAREAAFRELWRNGPAVLTFLRSLDPHQLDAEQWFRVRRLIAALSASYEEDMPQRVAAWLAPDARVWLALLNRDDQQKRRIAAEQLVALLGRPIDFDPAAEPETRSLQVERLLDEIQRGSEQEASN